MFFKKITVNLLLQKSLKLIGHTNCDEVTLSVYKKFASVKIIFLTRTNQFLLFQSYLLHMSGYSHNTGVQLSLLVREKPRREFGRRLFPGGSPLAARDINSFTGSAK